MRKKGCRAPDLSFRALAGSSLRDKGVHKKQAAGGRSQSSVAAPTPTSHEFDVAAAKIIAHAGSKAGRKLIEAWASDENSINRFIDLAPAYIALRRHLHTADIGD
ncbi:unnamed protein product [Dibothriocephalus latus]|uniref:Uncharacterized protein n=1 Tax=Dibothriocephalus latus TaxID=60516 RepID=A0A3P7M3N3_DIBLA|nr:unnamed protein product [Dibothriocephalus latus]